MLWSIFTGEAEARAWVDLLVAICRKPVLILCNIVFAEIAPFFRDLDDLGSKLESLVVGIDAIDQASAFAGDEIFKICRRDGAPVSISYWIFWRERIACIRLAAWQPVIKAISAVVFPNFASSHRNRFRDRLTLAESGCPRYNSPPMQPPRILSVLEAMPPLGVPGGDLVIKCRGFKPDITSKVLLGEVEAFILSASDDRIVMRLPESPKSIGVTLNVGKTHSAVFPFSLAARVSTDLHPVANPVLAPDGSVITTISGGRGEQIAQPLVRLTRRGEKIPYNCEVMNPTGLAFSRDGQLYISSRHDGTVLRYTDYERLDIIAEELGIPCGIVFDSKGLLYVGDRTGKIYMIDPSGSKEEFAELEPSISAYHLAVDSDDRLYVTGPTFSMRDCLMRFSGKGKKELLVGGLARPQGMAFLPDGDLLVCAGYEGKKGVFRYSQKDGAVSHFITAPIPIGLAISGREIFIATRDSIYWITLPGSSSVN